MSKQQDNQLDTDQQICACEDCPCQEELKVKDEEIRNYQNLYMRALADYKNLEYRVKNEREQMKDAIKKNLIEELLPVLDNLEQAQVFTKDPGLQMVAKSFMQALQKTGLEELELLGTEYDPYSAEVIDVVPGEQDNTVIEVLHKGYKLNGTVIRPGKVKVSKKSH